MKERGNYDQAGEKNNFFGRKHTAETKRKISEAHTGEKNYNFGKPSPRAKRKIICSTCGGPCYYLRKYCNRACYLNRNIKTLPDGTTLQKCTICKKHKPMEDDFYTHKITISGYMSQCKECLSKKAAIYNETPKAKKRKKQIRKDNPEREKVYRKKALPKKLEREKARRKEDPYFVLKNRMRCLMWQNLRETKNGRRWQDLTGYSIEKLKRHIEKQFTDGMTWEKFLNGEIHIDHKIPTTAFNFTKPEHRDFKRCWALKNLQPMWASENISKGNKLEKHFQPSLALGGYYGKKAEIDKIEIT